MGPFGDRPTLRAPASHCGGLGGLDKGPFILLHTRPARPPDQGSAPAEGVEPGGRRPSPCHCPGSWGLVWDPLSLGLRSGWERRLPPELLLPMSWVFLSRGPWSRGGLVCCSACPRGHCTCPSPLRASSLTGRGEGPGSPSSQGYGGARLAWGQQVLGPPCRAEGAARGGGLSCGSLMILEDTGRPCGPSPSKALVAAEPGPYSGDTGVGRGPWAARGAHGRVCRPGKAGLPLPDFFL